MEERLRSNDTLPMFAAVTVIVPSPLFVNGPVMWFAMKSAVSATTPEIWAAATMPLRFSV